MTIFVHILAPGGQNIKLGGKWMGVLVQMTFEDVTKLFYFMNFIPKSHILAKKVDVLTFFTCFRLFEGLPDWKGKNV